VALGLRPFEEGRTRVGLPSGVLEPTRAGALIFGFAAAG